MISITRYRLGLFIGLAVLIAFPVAYSFASSPTGFEIDAEFQNYYEQAGGLPVFGYAVSEPGAEDGRLVQYFERQRLELHPEHAGTPYIVLLGHLGWQDAERRGLLDHEAFQPNSSSNGEGRFFEETGQNLGGIFREYWNNHGLDFGDPGVSFRESLALFGYPISEEFVDPDTGLVTQYFERARFEHHPEHAGTEHEVLLGHLGNAEVEFLRSRGRGPDGNGPRGQRDRNNDNEEQEQQSEPETEPTAAPEPAPSEGNSSNNEVTPSMSIQQMVDNASSGATVTVPAGIYRETVTINKPITLVGEPGAEIRGDDESGNVVREYWIIGESEDVTIDGFTMRYASNRVQTGAISNNGYDNWTIQNNDLAYAAGANVSLLDGHNLVLHNNDIHHGGQLGVHSWNATDALLANNRIYANNTDNHGTGWEAGGMKFTDSLRMVLDGNEVYGNRGPGLWGDIDCYETVIRNNRIHHNTEQGIKLELSFGGTISNNVVYENGHDYPHWGWGAGIVLQNSSDVEVADNIVAWNADGISVISQRRDQDRWNHVRNNHVRDNVIIIEGRHDMVMALAWLEDWDGSIATQNANNRGERNQYYYTNLAPNFPFGYGDEWFDWDNLDGFNRTEGENDGRHLNASEKDQILANAGVPTNP